MVGKKPNRVLGNTFFNMLWNSMKKRKASRFIAIKKDGGKKSAGCGTPARTVIAKGVSNVHVRSNDFVDNDKYGYKKVVAKDTNESYAKTKDYNCNDNQENDGTEIKYGCLLTRISQEIPELHSDSFTGTETKDLVRTEGSLDSDFNIDMKEQKEDNVVRGKPILLKRSSEGFTEKQPSPCQNNPEAALSICPTCKRPQCPTTLNDVDNIPANRNDGYSDSDNDNAEIRSFYRLRRLKLQCPVCGGARFPHSRMRAELRCHCRLRFATLYEDE